MSEQGEAVLIEQRHIDAIMYAAEDLRGYGVMAHSNSLAELPGILNTMQAQIEALTARLGAGAVPDSLTVWFGSMPESNGKQNWTAILHKGDITEGFTLARSEYHDRVRYDADSVRYLIGEIETEPSILNYDGELIAAPKAPEAVPLSEFRLDTVRLTIANGPHWSEGFMFGVRWAEEQHGITPATTGEEK